MLAGFYIFLLLLSVDFLILSCKLRLLPQLQNTTDAFYSTSPTISQFSMPTAASPKTLPMEIVGYINSTEIKL